VIADAGPEALRCHDSGTDVGTDGAASAFLRLDRPELDGGSLVLRAVPARLRATRRSGRDVPLGYLYEPVRSGVPDRDMTFTAGHYDEANLVWSFSGELTGILGITEQMSPE
jgi:hypothetical protein